MKPCRLLYIIILSSIIVLAISCSAHKKELLITNPANIDREDELVVVKRSEIETHMGKLTAGKFVAVKKDKQPVAVQYDDMDGDGDWDELAFSYSFKANEKIRFTLSVADEREERNAVTRAHVRLRKKNARERFGPLLLKDTMPTGNPPTDFTKVALPLYQTEGPAWENDKCAFRLYFDVRNGRDIFGKLVPRMIMDTIGIDPRKNYHELSAWGMDILHVGRSLGAGAVAIAAKGLDGVDTVIRLGGMNIKNETYEVLSDGPVRAIFRINYEWEINEHPVHIVDETSIWGGQYFYETKLIITGTPRFAQAVTGFADFDNNVPGQINIAGSKIFYSYGAQSENKDSLGLAIAIDGAHYGWFITATDSISEVQHSYLVAQKFSAGEPVVYRFYSCWEKSDSQFKSEAKFEDYLVKQAKLLRQKLLVDWE
jgi:hypothetical protein